MISTGKLVTLSRVAAAAAAAAALLFLATVSTNAQEPPPPPTPHAADADGDKIFDDLENLISPADLDQTFPTVVLLEQPVTTDRINGLQRGIGQFDLEFEYDSVDGFAASLTKGQILALSQLDQVVQIEADRPVRLFLDTSTYWFGVQKARTDFGVDGNADGADTYSTGDMVIAVLDTGIDAAHVDLNGGKVVGWADFHSGSSGDPVCGSPCDPHGHGTHVSSIATGEGEGNALYRGVAPGAALVGVRVLSKYGSGSISGVNAGLQWVIDNKDTYNIRIINMSLGTSGCSSGTDSLSQMVNNVVAAGIVAVVSAGNSGPAACTIASPAAAEDAITVAAMADVGETGFNLAYFSSRGPTYDGRTKPDIAAPGRYIMAALRGSANGYTSMSGTSMSSPFVAGVAALMLDADPTLTPSQVKSTLMNTAVDWGPAGKDTDYGAGRLDAYESIRTADGGTGTNITVPNHQTMSGDLSATGDSDSYVIVVTDATKPIAITLVMSIWVSYGGGIDFDMELRDKDGVRVAISQGWKRQETIGLSSPGNGPYTFRVYSYSGSGPYFFDISVGGAIDSDGDGVPDDEDNCPAVSNPDQTNTDGDSMGDACDPDDDNDGQSDADETACGSDPLDDASLSPDNDSDGVPDCVDPDDDNDGQSDADETACGSDPLDDASLSPDNDSDGVPDCVDADDDNDGQSDADEVACGSDPLDDASLSPDNDSDGVPDCVDPDDDNDGQSDADETACGSDPLDDASLSPDNDADAEPDCVDADDDNDGVLDGADNCPLTANPGQEDTDGDGRGNACESGTPTSVPWGEGRIDVFARASDNGLSHRWYVRGRGWSDREDLGGVLKSGPDVSSWAEGRLDVFALDTDNKLRHKWYSKGQGWSGWENLGAPSGRTLTSNPGAVSWGDGRIDVFARASDDGLWHRSYVQSRGWSGWENLGGVLKSSPDVSSWAEGRLDVFALDTDNKLRHKWYVRGRGWSGWENLGAPSGLTLISQGRPVSWGDGRIDVFARASDDRLWHRWYVRGQGWSGWEDLGGVLNSAPDVSSWAEGRLDVFALDDDNKLRHKWYVRGRGWFPQALWQDLGGP